MRPMLSANSTPKSGEGMWLWLAKIASGVLVIVLLFVHLAVNHLIGSESAGLLTFEEVVAYLSNPWIALMEGSFLVIVVTHALLGVRSVLLDLNPSPRAVRLIDWSFSLLGLVSIAYGIWLLRVITSQGVSP